MTDIAEQLRRMAFDLEGDNILGAAVGEIDRLRADYLAAAAEIERLRAAVSDWGAKYGEARAEIERLREDVHYWEMHRLKEADALRAEAGQVKRERDAALDALAKSVERINDLVTEIKLWENDID